MGGSSIRPGIRGHHAALQGAVERGAKKIRVHILTDGRDVPDGSSIKFIQELEDVLAKTGVDAKIASGGGRMMVSMDRYEVRKGGTARSTSEVRPAGEGRLGLTCRGASPLERFSRVRGFPLAPPLSQSDWNIVKRGWDAHVLGVAPHKFTDALTAVKTLRVRAWPPLGFGEP